MHYCATITINSQKKGKSLPSTPKKKANGSLRLLVRQVGSNKTTSPYFERFSFIIVDAQNADLNIPSAESMKKIKIWIQFDHFYGFVIKLSRLRGFPEVPKVHIYELRDISIDKCFFKRT